MNRTLPHTHPIADVQGAADARDIPINWVGIKSLRYPVCMQDLPAQNAQQTVATFAMHVALPGHQRGTHMSRFLEILEAMRNERQILTWPAFAQLTEKVRHTLGSHAARVVLCFPFFMEKKAPVSQVSSLMDYAVQWTCTSTLASTEDEPATQTGHIQVTVPVTSLCPCSKTVSDYGAHNQRSHVTIGVEPRSNDPHLVPALSAIIQLAEQHASAPLYGLLKRPDEKFVTEYAYDHPKFVEDMVRDIAQHLSQWPHIGHFSVESENFESIHHHSAHALITR